MCRHSPETLQPCSNTTQSLTLVKTLPTDATAKNFVSVVFFLTTLQETA